MSMPHPRVLMIPFGCVVKLSKKKSGYVVDIYSRTELEDLPDANPALAELASEIDTWDDLSASLCDDNALSPGVVQNASITVNKNWVAMKLRANDKHAKPVQLSVAELQDSMWPDYYYYLVLVEQARRRRGTGRRNTRTTRNR